MGVHDGHRNRLKTRFLKHGLEQFDEHTVLELILFYSRPRCDTNELAHRLIERFGSFAGVLDAPYEELVMVPEIGENSALLMKLIPAAGAYYYESQHKPGDIINSTEKAGSYFMPKFFGKRNEEVWLACLDDTRKVVRCAKVSDEGIVNAVRITVKRIVTEAVNANASSIIMSHNHPGGIALPSTSDKQITMQVYQALKLINVQLADHIIVAGGDFVSMADSGYIDIMQRGGLGG